MQERIQKIMANMGIASRRKAEEMIAEGRVFVNGRPAEIGMKADPEHDFIKVDGKPLVRPEPKVYFAFHKPREVVSTLEDPEGRSTVGDFFKKVRWRVYPVGRLDYHSEGLLLVTNDGEFANMVLHPSKKISKTYEVKVEGVLAEEEMEQLRAGIRLEEGVTQPAKVRPLRKTQANSWVEVIIQEGKKRQIRRMMDRVGHSVIKLKRTSIDVIKLGTLPPGQYRPLDASEIEHIKKASGALVKTETGFFKTRADKK